MSKTNCITGFIERASEKEIIIKKDASFEKSLLKT
jgi:hypothetical protein